MENNLNNENTTSIEEKENVVPENAAPENVAPQAQSASEQNSGYSYIPTQPNASNGAVANDLGSVDLFNKHSQTSMILGIIALSLEVCCGCFCFLGIPTIVLGILSLVFGFKAKKLSPNGKFGGKALAGIICSVIGLVMTVMCYLGILIIEIFAEVFVEALNEALGEQGYDFYYELK